VTTEFSAFRDVVDKNRKFVLTTHVSPDGDGIGSELALASFLKQRGKDANVINHSPTPPNYAFLDPGGLIEAFDRKKHSPLLSEADVIIVLDTNHPDRLVSMKDAFVQSKAYKICIDHHLDPADFADLYLIDEPSTATGEIVYRLLMSIHSDAITKEVATYLYTAIMTDTGSFRYPKTDSEVHRIIAHLIEQGADPVSIYENVYDRSSLGRLRLLGRALANLQVVHGGRVAYLIITQQMMSESGANESDTDLFVTYAMSVEGVKIGMMFTELNGGVKINFRSKGDIPINNLAKEFGGNGHKNAAGARLADARLSEILSKVVERSAAYIKET